LHASFDFYREKNCQQQPFFQKQICLDDSKSSSIKNLKITADEEVTLGGDSKIRLDVRNLLLFCMYQFKYIPESKLPLFVKMEEGKTFLWIGKKFGKFSSHHF
jgi:hypothetical protein